MNSPPYRLLTKRGVIQFEYKAPSGVHTGADIAGMWKYLIDMVCTIKG